MLPTHWTVGNNDRASLAPTVYQGLSWVYFKSFALMLTIGWALLSLFHRGGKFREVEQLGCPDSKQQSQSETQVFLTLEPGSGSVEM